MTLWPNKRVQSNGCSMCVVHDDNRDIAKLCNELRETIGMSIAELARRIGADRKRLWYVLNGQREMRVDEFLKICIALKVDPRIFITRKMIKEIRGRIMR